MFHEQRRRWGETAVARQGEWGEWATMAASGAVDGGAKNSARRAYGFVRRLIAPVLSRDP
jgi:hypothetical protein